MLWDVPRFGFVSGVSEFLAEPFDGSFSRGLMFCCLCEVSGRLHGVMPKAHPSFGSVDRWHLQCNSSSLTPDFRQINSSTPLP